ncbi:hypothetical protein IIO_00153 [Bacillus cereus VD115]|nr:hypothetical protein IIO_00153 [Bacillus cereus VD115]
MKAAIKAVLGIGVLFILRREMGVVNVPRDLLYKWGNS